MKERITQFLVNENISSAEFADRIGVQRSSVSHILNGRNSPGTSFIQKMLSVYKKLNPRWLLLGEGSMFSAAEASGREPSLFPYPEEDISASIVNHEATNEESKNKKVLSKEAIRNKKPEEEPGSVSEQIEEKNPRNFGIEHLENKPDLKDVKRIILFHQDKTFTEYTPSK